MSVLLFVISAVPAINLISVSLLRFKQILLISIQW